LIKKITIYPLKVLLFLLKPIISNEDIVVEIIVNIVPGKKKNQNLKTQKANNIFSNIKLKA